MGGNLRAFAEHQCFYAAANAFSPLFGLRSNPNELCYELTKVLFEKKLGDCRAKYLRNYTST